MQSLLDDVARILAKPAPRRQALKLAAGVFAGGILAALGLKADGPDITCKPGYVACGNHGVCCLTTEKCCITTTRGAFCVAKQSYICCGNTACGSKEVCCNNVCCSPGQKCVSGRCSSSNAAS